jgi:TrmH family RNA methyltransferase
METINSRTNSKVKRARALRDRRGRETQGAFLVEGIHHVGAAFEAGAQFEETFFAPDLLEGAYAESLLLKLSDRGIPCHPVTIEVFNSLASKEHPQGVLAVVRKPQVSLDGLTPANFSWGAALVAPQDPGNVGAILRTIDAAGAEGLILLEGGVDPYHPTSVRASMGAITRMPVVTASFTAFARWIREQGYHVCGTSAHAEADYRSVTGYSRPLVLLFGSEREGLSAEQAAVCERMVSIPMHGKATSLNLAVAVGIMLYAVLDQFDPENHSIW